MFKTNPKQLAERSARNTFGAAAKVKIVGERPNREQCGIYGVKMGTYVVHLYIDGKLTDNAFHTNWRKAYLQLNDAIKSLATKKLLEQAVQTHALA